jgi:thymidine kinase
MNRIVEPSIGCQGSRFMCRIANGKAFSENMRTMSRHRENELKLAASSRKSCLLQTVKSKFNYWPFCLQKVRDNMRSFPTITQHPVGRIELIIGPMFAGKTTELIRRIERCEHQHLSCILFTHSWSTDHSRPAIACERLRSHFRECLAYDVIAIDESQFFSDVVIFAPIMANSGKLVLIAGLDGTFLRNPFGHILELVFCCESITKLTGICSETGEAAPFTRRIVDRPEVNLVGGTESYRAVSRSAYFGNRKSGSVQLVIGPVKSGKTTELARLLNRHSVAGKRVLSLCKEMVDSDLPGVGRLAEFDVIGVDDGEIFEGIADWADRVANEGKCVVIAALDGNEQQEAFLEVVELIPRCESLKKLQFVCPLTGLPAPISAMVGMTAMPISGFALVSGLAGAGLVGGKECGSTGV